jgi:CHAD domain-containing protein
MTQPVETRNGHDGGRQLQTAALLLFDNAAQAHRLPSGSRKLLQLAAACYATAQQASTDRADRIGRDLALATPIDGLSSEQQCIVASAVAFQRDKLRRNREPAFLRLSSPDQDVALRLAAMLQLADAISSAPNNHVAVQNKDGKTILLIGGAPTDTIATNVNAGGERWRKLIGALDIQADMHTEAPPAPTDTPVLLTLDLPMHGSPEQLSGDESMAEGARRMLRRTFEKMLAREDGVIDGEDPEDVHQMRVATRKLRASLQIVETVYDPKLIRDFRRKLRRVANELGIVRDYDVFSLDVQAYQASLPEAERAIVQPLVTAVEAKRAKARAELLNDLDTPRYDRFKHAFALFLTTPGAGVADTPETGVQPRVRDRAGSMIWQRYEQWRAFEVVLSGGHDETLHMARIAGKRFRYTLEFFADALGPKVDQLIDPLVALQDTLGRLQDGVVARAHIQTLGMLDDPGAQMYMAAQEVNREQYLAQLPGLWDKVVGATYRRRLFEAIAKM